MHKVKAEEWKFERRNACDSLVELNAGYCCISRFVFLMNSLS